METADGTHMFDAVRHRDTAHQRAPYSHSR